MRLPFNEAKAAQVAVRLLNLHGNRMSLIKLIKLMYLVDRRSLIEWGRPVTTDRYVAMEHGPVVSNVYDLIKNRPAKGEATVWYCYVSCSGNDVRALQEHPILDELSPAEEKLIDKVYAEFGSLNRWELRDYTHEHLAEWKDPNGSSAPIEYRNILQAQGKTDIEIAAVESELKNLAFLESLTSR